MPKIIVKEEVTRVVKVGGIAQPGPAGPGVPAGGTTGQLLRKTTGDFNTEWSDTAPDTDKVAGVAAGTVLDRLGAVETGQASAVIGRATQAELLAVVPPDEDAVGYVGADPDPAKNGNYHREGGSWVQSSYDRVAQVETKAAANEKRVWPFAAEATLENVSEELVRAIIDIEITGGNPAWRVVPYTFHRGGIYGHYIRLCVFKADDTLDTTVGDGGVIARWQAHTYTEPTPVEGKVLEKLTFQEVWGITAATITVDWSAITLGAARGVQSYTRAGLSPLIFHENRGNNYVSREEVSQALPLAEESVWARANTFRLGNIDNAILDAKIYGGDQNKRYGIERLRFYDSPGERSFIAICEYAQDGTKGSRVCLWDNVAYNPPAVVNGRQIDTVSLSESSGSGVSAVITIDWAKIPKSGTGWDGSGWYSNAFTVTDGEFSMKALATGNSVLQGSQVINSQLDGVDFRLTTSNGYDGSGEPDTLLILLHGNGSNYTYTPSANFVAFCKANKISFACISGQDEVSAPFTTDASGWGNYIHLQRNIRLYDHLMGNYNFKPSVILAGASMGGLVMGHLAYTKPFPILFCLGVGPVPSLAYIFANGGESRRAPIRNAYGMASDGSDDAALDMFAQGHDWYRMGMLDIGGTLHKVGFPHLYMYLGTGDTTATVDFGGMTKYNEIRDAIRAAGGFCITKDVGAVSHADSSIYDQFLTDQVMERELGI